ncbi:transposase [Streptomyces sp. Y7]|uniref:transposase n=1 Tax=Streptomyces sp. Y7 TaxID=3342392 RepID=UPI003716B384
MAGHGQGPQAPTPQQARPFKPYLEQRWAETDGNETILDLYREITTRGFRGHYSTVRDWARRDLPRQEGFTPAPPPPSVRQVTGWLTRHPATLTEEERLHRKAVLDRCPELATAADLTSSFAEMLTTLSGTRLPGWIARASDANLPGISSFAVGLRADFDAVTAGLTTDWNSGPVEGAVNRIKMLKRQMFGRAGFGLLRKRVLLTS